MGSIHKRQLLWVNAAGATATAAAVSLLFREVLRNSETEVPGPHRNQPQRIRGNLFGGVRELSKALPPVAAKLPDVLNELHELLRNLVRLTSQDGELSELLRKHGK